MTVNELKVRIEAFYEKVKTYRGLLGRSRGRVVPTIESNHAEIGEARRWLLRDFAKLESYIRRLGKNPKMNDGVWNVWYSPYDNAFTNDILERRGPSLDAVLNDLDLIVGKLETMDDQAIVDDDRRISDQPKTAVNDDTSKMTEEELLAVIRRNENVNVPTGLHQRAKTELELRDRQNFLTNNTQTHMHGDVINIGSIQADHKAVVGVATRLMKDPEAEVPWYKVWWMQSLVYAFIIGLCVWAVTYYLSRGL